MFHAISAFFARLPRRIRAQAYADAELATWHGWTFISTGLGTYRYRDPRFDTRQPAALRQHRRRS